MKITNSKPMKNSKIENIFNPTTMYLLSMLIPKFAVFLFLPIYSRYLTPYDFGIIKYSLSITTIYSALSAFGFNTYYLRFYFSYEDKRKINGSVYWSLLIWNLVLFLICIIFLPFVFGTIHIAVPFFPYIFIALATQLFKSMELIPLRTFRLNKEVKKYFSRSVSQTVLSIILTLVFVINLRLGASGKLIAELISASVFALIFIRYMHKHSYFAVDLKIIKEGLKFSIPLVIGDLLTKTMRASGTIIIERFVNLASLGVFSIANYFSMVVEYIFAAIYMSAEPDLFKMADKSNFFPFFIKFKNLYFPFVCFSCFTIGIFSREVLIILFSEAYHEAWPYVQFLVVSSALYSYRSLFSMMNFAQKKTWVDSLSSVVGCISEILTIVLLANSFGLYAAATATIISRFIALCISYTFIKKDKEQSYGIIKDFLTILIMVSFFYLANYLNMYNFYTTIFFKSLLFILYGYYITLSYNLRINDLKKILKRK